MLEEKQDKYCLEHTRVVKDALETLSGKWRIEVLVALCDAPRRFNELQRDIRPITARMLSRELQELERHELIIKYEDPAQPGVVIYAVSEHGNGLDPLIIELKRWGTLHRKRMLGKTDTAC